MRSDREAVAEAARERWTFWLQVLEFQLERIACQNFKEAHAEVQARLARGEDIEADFGPGADIALLLTAAEHLLDALAEIAATERHPRLPAVLWLQATMRDALSGSEGGGEEAWPAPDWSITAGGMESSYVAAGNGDWRVAEPLPLAWLTSEIRSLANEVLDSKELNA